MKNTSNFEEIFFIFPTVSDSEFHMEIKIAAFTNLTQNNNTIKQIIKTASNTHITSFAIQKIGI